MVRYCDIDIVIELVVRYGDAGKHFKHWPLRYQALDERFQKLSKTDRNVI